MAKSLGGSSSKRKSISTPTISTIPLFSNFKNESNYQEGYDQELDDSAYNKVEEELEVDEEEKEEEPSTFIEVISLGTINNYKINV